jgi:DNA primase
VFGEAQRNGACRVSGRIPEELIADIRARTDIVEVIGRYVELKRSGINHKGLCPFHDEKTPSFNVNGARQFFHCFGCQESGDVIAFLMRIEGRTFVEVVEDLATKAGVELPQHGLSPEQVRDEQRRRSDRQRALELNMRVARYYRRCLSAAHGEAARDYLAHRGIGEEMSERFLLGFAPKQGSQLSQTLQQKGLDLAFAEQIGLIAHRRGRSGYHDRFWNRLIFPLRSPTGDVIGFGGRLLEGSDGPKYVNTPETALFHKGESLYGLSVAAPAIRKLGVSLLVEGNFDVLQMHQHGFENAVAPLGTALTVSQVKLLRRFAPRVVALFDGDAAGRAAACKAVKTLIEGQLEAKIASLPVGTDPDSLLLEQGPDAMRAVIDDAVSAIDYLIDSLKDGADSSIPARARLLEEVAPLIASLPRKTEQALYVDRLSLELQIARPTVERVVRGQRSAFPRTQVSQRGPSPANDSGRARPVKQQQIDRLELELLKLLMEHPRLLSRAEQSHLAVLLSSEALRSAYASALSMQRDNGELDTLALMQHVPEELREAVATAAMSHEYASDGDPTRALDDCVASLAARRSACMLQRVRDRIVKAQRKTRSAQQERPIDAAAEFRRLDVLTKIQSRINRARERHEAEQVWSLVPELVEVEREIHETQ